MNNENFKEYVTGQSFVLSLTQRQIQHLAWVAGDCDDKGLLNTSFGSWNALRKRGLIQWRKYIHVFKGERKVTKTGPFMTREGELVYKLLYSSGLVDTKAIARNRSAKHAEEKYPDQLIEIRAGYAKKDERHEQ